MTNEYYNVETHKILDTENSKVKLLVQSMSHKEGTKADFVDIRKFRSYEGKPLMYTAKGVHFSEEQLKEVIEGLMDVYVRIHGVDKAVELADSILYNLCEYKDV